MDLADSEKVASQAQRAVELATLWLAQANRNLNHQEKQRAEEIHRLVSDAVLKNFTVTLCDRLFRATSAEQAATYFRAIIKQQGIPRAMPWTDRVLLRTASWCSHLAPQLVVSQMMQRLRREAAEVIWPAQVEAWLPRLKSSQAQGFQHTYNRLGEAVLGEAEATKRLQQVLELLSEPEVTRVSVKISNLYSQVSVLAFEASVRAIQERLRLLYRAAQQSLPAKLVNLDMEEYRDLELTVEAFMRTLNEPEFKNLTAGIVLQAYLPEAFLVQQRLTAWALDRVAHGGAPIRVRLVKGANLAMEQVEAELHDWVSAPYATKAEVDANYKRMLAWGAEPSRLAAVRIGVASHNLLDLAWAEILRQEYQLGDGLSFEMLEGMAPAQARAVQAQVSTTALYTPLVATEEFGVAIAYLLRRLEENTAPGNFLRELFFLSPEAPAWQQQIVLFKKALWEAAHLPCTPRRWQDRRQSPAGLHLSAPFKSASDTDWTSVANREWIKVALTKQLPAPLMPATVEAVEGALTTAVNAVGMVGDETMRATLCRAALVLEQRRDQLIAWMVQEGKKIVAEADVEVSEAIDFANYYARAFDDKNLWQGARRSPLGVVVVASPWNFPMAIPFGGIVGALRTGNAVIFKPAPEVRRCGQLLCQILWEVGIPRELLHFVPAPDNEVGQKLITDERVNAVILTGSSETAKMFLQWRPDLKLLAETSGKNAMIITPSADRDQAIKDIVKSAFGHAGQKCSACSLLVLVGELGQDHHFLAQLKDAAASLPVGLATDLQTFIPPLMQAPGPILQRGLTQLDEGETWLLEPRCVDESISLWTPGIRLGVTAQSWFTKAECFGPVLGVVTVPTLKAALEFVNASHFGLTGGLHSLDEDEIGAYLAEVEVGNVYVNRPITGAIVHRQPFGGRKLSAFGAGAKAGGPWALAALARWENEFNPAWNADHLSTARQLMETPAEQVGLKCEANIYRRTTTIKTLVRFGADADLASCHRILDLVVAMGHVWEISVDPSLDPYLIERVAKCASFCEVENAEVFAEKMAFVFPRIRYVGTPSPLERQALSFAHAALFEAPVTSCPALELHAFYWEQSISFAWHRYGQAWPMPQAEKTRKLWQEAGLLR